MGFYQRYEDQKFEAKEKLSVEIDPKPGEVSRFPPGVKPADLTRAEDSSEQIMGDAFKALESGTVDIAILSQANQNYKAKVEAEPEKSLSDISQELGPGQVGGDAVYGPPLPGLGGAQVPATSQECTVENIPFNPAAGTLPTDVVNNCAETGGIHDKIRNQNTIDGEASETTEDNSVDPRTESGRREKGTALAGFVQCAKDAVYELWELIVEIAGLLKDGALGIDHQYGTGLFGDEEDWIEFNQKISEIRKELATSAQAGVEFLAAVDHFYPVVTTSHPVFSSLTRVIKWFYSEKEWAAMAAKGKENAQKIVDHFRKEWEENTEHAIGYLICTVVSLLTPRAILKAIKVARGLGKTVDALDGPDVKTGPKPDAELPGDIVDDAVPGSKGQPTPNGSPRIVDKEGEVQRRPTTPDDPDAVLDPNVPDGMPKYYKLGSYDGPSVEDAITARTNRQINKQDYAKLKGEIEDASALGDLGYNVKLLDDPIKGDQGRVKTKGDYGFDGKGADTKPDYRINGVTFDRFIAETPNSMYNRFTKKISKLHQARNFVVRVPGDGDINKYYNRLSGSGMGPGSEVGDQIRQVILIDSRTGRIKIWTNPNPNLKP